jgi:magnesium transporter
MSTTAMCLVPAALYILTKENELMNCQFSGIVKDNMVISFEESHQNYFSAVETRLEAGKGVIRTAGPGYIFYALTDTILDNYFVSVITVGRSDRPN